MQWLHHPVVHRSRLSNNYFIAIHAICIHDLHSDHMCGLHRQLRAVVRWLLCRVQWISYTNFHRPMPNDHDIPIHTISIHDLHSDHMCGLHRQLWAMVRWLLCRVQRVPYALSLIHI